MREIKFRGMDIKGNWYYGNVSILPQRVHDVPAGTYISNSAGCPFAYAVRPETVGQYIELKDKNKKEIYGGGIVKDPDGENCEVTWGDGGFVFYPGDVANQTFCDESEVIGNKWENKELLKQGR